MTKVLKLYSSILLLHAVFPIFTASAQQQVNSLAKETLADGGVYSPYSAKNDVKDVHPDSVTVVERDTSFMQINTKLKIAKVKFKQNTATIAKYVKENDFNTEYCFLVDMSIPSGKKRFFVYNIRKDSIESSSLVSHGSGSYKPGCNDQLEFSNLPNSYATSLGKYKIGNAYNGTFGLSFKLYGLDSTNSNAYQRAIVLHSDRYVSETETYPRHIFESAGCPAVSPSFLPLLNKYIKNSSKPVLLWIYN